MSDNIRFTTVRHLIPGNESWASIQCPCANFPEDVKRPKIKMLSFTPKHTSNELSAVDTNNLRFFRELPHYEYARKNGAIALIAYNTRNENITPDALIERGYDRNGWPYVPY